MRIGKIDDFITSLSPGVSLQYGQNLLDSNFIGLDYTLTQNWYAENSEISSDNHAVTFAINYQKEGKFRLSGTDSIRLDNTILSGRERSTSFIGGKRLVERSYFNDQYRFDYIFSPKDQFIHLPLAITQQIMTKNRTILHRRFWWSYSICSV